MIAEITSTSEFNELVCRLSLYTLSRADQPLTPRLATVRQLSLTFTQIGAGLARLVLSTSPLSDQSALSRLRFRTRYPYLS